MATFHKKLVQIQEANDFGQLDSLKDSSVWKDMSIDERALFAQLLLRQGEHLLSKGDPAVLENFQVAESVAPSAELFMEQGRIFASYQENIRCLNLASQAFQKATNLQSSLFLAWYEWAKVLMLIGLFEGELNDFAEADRKFSQAAFLHQHQSLAEPLKDELYWQWARCLSFLGQHSGEPIDLHRAIEKFRNVRDSGFDSTAFLSDYGQTLVQLANLTNRPELFIEALNLFDEIVDKAPDFFDGWYLKGVCLHKLFQMGYVEDIIEDALHCFERAAEIDPQHSQLFVKWGQLQAAVGKLNKDTKIIEDSLAKFERASQLDPQAEAQILTCWGEVELFLGASKDDLSIVHSAKSKILKSIELQPECEDNWYLYGSCLNELGRYFTDENYYHQAIEKFHYGLTLCRQNPLFWYGLALSHFALGELNGDVSTYEKAAYHCSKVLEAGGSGFPQFWNDWGITLLKLAEVTEKAHYAELAIEKFEKALKSSQAQIEDGDIDLEWVFNYACALDLLGDLTDESKLFEKASQIFTQIVQFDPDYTVARYHLALTLSHLGEATFDVEPYYKAVEHFQILVEKDREDENVHLDYGVALVNLALLVHDIHKPDILQGYLKQAEYHFSQAVALGQVMAYYHLAGLLSLLGQFDEALHYLERSKTFNALPPKEELLHDEWLEGLRETPAFKHFMSQLPGQQHLSYED